jgi:hypothetical protein
LIFTLGNTLRAAEFWKYLPLGSASVGHLLRCSGITPTQKQFACGCYVMSSHQNVEGWATKEMVCAWEKGEILHYSDFAISNIHD